MSKSNMRERNKAIRAAWEREQKLVAEGKGTRDWTEEQQRDILDPDKGKAYDEDGRAFEGQHMKSAAKYPKYLGDPNNIQFLTREEHLTAHKGSWQNPTNWYYNPETKKFVDFGDNAPVPCKVIFLSNPVMSPITEAKKSSEKLNNTSKAEEPIIKQSQSSKQEKNPQNSESASHKNTAPKSSPKTNKTFWKKIVHVAAAVKEFSEQHPIISGIAGATALAIGTVAIANSNSGGGKSSGDSDSDFSSVPDFSDDCYSISNNDLPLEINSSDDNLLPANGENLDAVGNPKNGTEDDCNDSSISIDCTEKRPYTPNDVPAGGQNYKTKEGRVWREKAGYHRPRDDKQNG